MARPPIAIPGTVLNAFLRSVLNEQQTHALVERLEVPRQALTTQEKLLPAGIRLLWMELERVTHDPLLGLHAAIRMDLDALGPYYQLLKSCPNLRAAIELGVRYLPMVHSHLEVGLRVIGDQATVTSTLHGRRFFRQEADFFAALLHRIACELVPDITFSAMHLPQAEDSRSGVYEEHFRCPVVFGDARPKGTFPARFLDTPFRRANEARRQELETIARERQPDEDRGGVLDRIYSAAICEGHSERGAIAAHAGISTYRLQTFLKARSTNHREQLDRCRRNIALSWVERGDLTNREIAERLGFSHPVSFQRAFRRWTGSPPGAFRRTRSAPREARTIWVQRQRSD